MLLKSLIFILFRMWNRITLILLVLVLVLVLVFL